MIISLDELNSNVKDELLIDEELNFDEEYFDDSLKGFEKIHFDGKIIKDLSNEIVINGKIDGIMLLEDSISLDIVKYPFEAVIDESLEENLENNQNTIDILPILWQNIILEIPLRYTEVKDLSSYSGDGWKLISEEEDKNNDNPFLEFSKNFKEE